MVTGDNIHTARHIARECGILTESGVALEGPNFRNMPAHELIPLLPKLQVRADCTFWFYNAAAIPCSVLPWLCIWLAPLARIVRVGVSYGRLDPSPACSAVHAVTVSSLP
jgi:hypothetical protein